MSKPIAECCQFGNIIDHPDRLWVARARNIASWPIVAGALQGRAGVKTFYFPFLKRRMIAGYASVPEFHWTVLTPQPLAEVTARAHTLVMEGAAAGLLGLMCALLIGGLLAGSLVRLLRAIEEDMLRMQGGDFLDLLRPHGFLVPHEMESLRIRSRRMSRAVQAALHFREGVHQELEQRVRIATTEPRTANRRLERESLIDDLTQLGNRRMLGGLVARLEQRSDTVHLPVSILLSNIDYFKQVNDTEGHGVGDQLLMHVARILGEDTRDWDHMIRYSGDELLVVMTSCDMDTSWRRAESLRQAVFAQPLPTSTSAF